MLLDNSFDVWHVCKFGPILSLTRVNWSSPVAGLLFKHPDYATEVLAYIERCWAIFQGQCKVIPPPANDESMTCRELLWLFKVGQTYCKKKLENYKRLVLWSGLSYIGFQDLRLLDENLTTARVMEMVTAGRPDNQNFSSFLYVKVDLHHLISLFCLQCHSPNRLDIPSLLCFSFPSWTSLRFSWNVRRWSVLVPKS